MLELDPQAGEQALAAGALEGLGRLRGDAGLLVRAEEVRARTQRPAAPYECTA